MVGKHLIDHPLADHVPVLDRTSVVDAAPDASVADLVLQVFDQGEMTVAEPSQTGDGEVDLLRA